jgi:hypothetical protein
VNLQGSIALSIWHCACGSTQEDWAPSSSPLVDPMVFSAQAAISSLIWAHALLLHPALAAERPINPIANSVILELMLDLLAPVRAWSNAIRSDGEDASRRLERVRPRTSSCDAR